MTSETVLLSYSTVGMAAREVMLLKSFVRMLEGRTAQRWLFKPQQGAHEQQLADLIFVGDEGAVPEPSPGAAQVARQLRMGVLAIDLYASINRPLRPDELERELNRMGSLLVQARAAQANGEAVGSRVSASGYENVRPPQASALWRPVSEGSAHSEFTPSTASPRKFAQTGPAGWPEKEPLKVALPMANSPRHVKIAVGLDDRLSFPRWPHANLVSTPARLKMASIMVGGKTLGKLQENSGQSIQACTEFVQDMHAAGFLSVLKAGGDSLVVAADLSVVGSSPDHATVTKAPAELPEKSVQDTPVLPGLLSRIRARLGMSPAG